MKKILCVCITGALCIALAGCSNSQKTSVSSVSPTSSLASIPITSESDYSSSSVSSNSKNSEDNWQLKYYVDEFGDNTNEKYACYVEYGTFSNTATNDSNLIVYIMVDSDDVAIQLYEYGSNIVKNSYSHRREYNITTKDESGNKIPFSGFMASGSGDRIYLSDNGKGHFLNHMKKSTENLRFHIVESDNPTTYYDFTVSPSGFKDVYNKLA